jgi:hypothetical protein
MSKKKEDNTKGMAFEEAVKRMLNTPPKKKLANKKKKK